MQNRCALKPLELSQIEKDFQDSAVTDYDVFRMIETVKIQRQSIEYLLGLFRDEPLKIISAADPVRTIQLTEIRNRCSIETQRGTV
jgi:hypothetical protein